jgi:hypothetical protein
MELPERRQRRMWQQRSEPRQDDDCCNDDGSAPGTELASYQSALVPTQRCTHDRCRGCSMYVADRLSEISLTSAVAFEPVTQRPKLKPSLYNAGQVPSMLLSLSALHLLYPSPIERSQLRPWTISVRKFRVAFEHLIIQDATLLQLLNAYLRPPHHRWKAPQMWLEAYGCLFDTYRSTRQWYSLAELLPTLAISIMTGVKEARGHVT